MSRLAMLLLACVPVLAAGCAAGPDEASPRPACEAYETVHYAQAPEQEALRRTFEEALYEWDVRSDRIAEATTPGGEVIVLSHVPGMSGEDLILSTTGPDAHETAVAGATLVNLTDGESRIVEWVADDQC